MRSPIPVRKRLVGLTDVIEFELGVSAVLSVPIRVPLA